MQGRTAEWLSRQGCKLAVDQLESKVTCRLLLAGSRPNRIKLTLIIIASAEFGTLMISTGTRNVRMSGFHDCGPYRSPQFDSDRLSPKYMPKMQILV